MSAIVAKTSLHLQRQQTQLIWTKINELRRTATLCDVVLKSVEGTTFMAHRLILVSSAKYFANALLNTEPWVVPVNLPEVLITPVLDYLYGEKISVGKDMLPQLASMAEFLGIEELKGSCEQAMQSALSQPTQSVVTHQTQSGLSQPTQSDLSQPVHPELSHLTQPDVPQPLQSSDVDVVVSMLSGNNSSVDPKTDANNSSTTTEQPSQKASPAVNCNSTSGEGDMATDRGATRGEGEMKQGNNRRPYGLREGSIKLESLKDLPDILACLNPREREAVNTAMKMVEQNSLQTEAHSEETDQEAGVLANVPLHGIMGRLEKPKDSTRMGSGSASKRKSKPRHIVQIRPRVTVDELLSPPGKRKRGRPRQSAPSQPKITKVKRKRKSKPKSSSKSKPEKDYVPHNQPKNFDKTSYVCKLCHSSFTLSVSAKKHMLQQHRYRRKTGFYLQLRRYRYVGATGAHTGRKKERKTWPCHKCFKTFTDQLHLDLHTRLKHQTLGRPSKRSSSVRTHNKEKVLGTWTAFQLRNLLTRPYFSGKIVSQKRPLRARSTRRVPSLQKKTIRSAISKLKKTCARTKTKTLLQCHHCEEKFKSRVGLEDHIQIMHGSSICDQCGEEVAQKQMALHMAETHGLGHRFYKDKDCEKCQQTFQLKEIFKFHWKQTHDIDVFPCAAKECDEYFLSYTAWCRHMQFCD
ncbi:uncharacterized protein LOC106152854 [Lingula anatina]|uniref:Uncharacterized protein LOC106152854 n=1 Tax=Lingula anatina TaxID=7574 RepID=A0A1S3HAA5_LINAN|nr:uncharacterized protein LOC106152854 [Lingula anatina]|eukprot:XP_013382044.1 uncharacterized protein LOC106152854 [Lingula anatina]